jgi:4-hydroxy-tetrahydrodipicolinate synthase
MYAPFGSIITAMVTPFDNEGKLAEDLVEGLVNHLVESGTDTVLVNGTTGESPTLTEEEVLQLIRCVRKHLPKGVKLMVGTGTNSTAKSVVMTKRFAAEGVDAFLLASPYYNKPTQEGLEAHFRAVAEGVKPPILIYNIPGRSAVNVEPETFARLAEVKNIVGVKEASGSVDQAARIRAMTPEEGFAVYSGDDALTLPMLSVGAVGVVSVASHLAGKRLKKMIESFFKGDVEEAGSIHLSLLPLFQALFCRPNPIPVKYALNRVGRPVGGHRLPLTPLDEAGREIVDSALKQVGLMS